MFKIGSVAGLLLLSFAACGDDKSALIDAGVTDTALVDAPDALVPRSCPAPTVPDGPDCILAADAVLTETMIIPADTNVDCRGHRLTPGGAGVLDNPRTTANEFQASAPDLAMFVHQAHGVTIQNCVLDSFDFGIVMARAKEVGVAANEIRRNTIRARTTTIYLVQTDRVTIADNQLTYASERGRGVVVEQDSDENVITGNTITSTDLASTGHVRQQPGGRFVPGTPAATLDDEIHILLGNTMVRSFVVNGALIQIAASEAATATNLDDVSRPDHNVVENNQFIDYGFGDSCTLDPGIACTSNADCTPSGTGPCLFKANAGVALNLRASDNIVDANTFFGIMGRGISNGGTGASFDIPAWTPGTCTDDASRLCAGDADCNIDGYDDTAKGTCSGAVALTTNGNTVRNISEENTLNGMYYTAAIYVNNSEEFIVRKNVIGGGPGVFAAIRLEGSAVTGTVERNIVRSAVNALYLHKPPTVTNTIRLNDLTGYTTAVRTTDDYTLATELGGNYWGLPCPGLDANTVKFANNTLNANVTDSQSYGEPIAMHADPLPDRCTP